MKPLRILVTAAGRHGATHEIADALARALTDVAAGDGPALLASAVPVERRPDPDRYDAVVLGSAVYGGSWLPGARRFAADHAESLRSRPLWLFSSGPIGPPPFPEAEPYDIATMRGLLHPVEHRVLPGRMDPALLSFGERAMVTAMRAPVGDFRDWAALCTWATEIAGQLTTGRLAPVPADA